MGFPASVANTSVLLGSDEAAAAMERYGFPMTPEVFAIFEGRQAIQDVTREFRGISEELPGYGAATTTTAETDGRR